MYTLDREDNPTKENILLIGDIIPCTNYSGGIFLNQLSRIIIESGHNFFGFFFKNKYLKPSFDPFVRNNGTFYTTDFDEDEYHKTVNIDVAKQCIGFIRRFNITKIWCYVQSSVILQLIDYVSSHENIPLYIQIMDPIDWHIIDMKYSPERAETLLKAFDRVIERSEVCITASERMNEIYAEKYKTNCKYLTIHIKENDYSDFVKPKNDKIVISMVGQVYCHEELKSFLMTLERMNWNFNGKPIIFEHFGTWCKEYSDWVGLDNYSKDKIFIRGFIPQDDLIDRLCCSDLLYCPYFFSDIPAFKKVSSESFPSKLTTYLASATPALVHAPEYASPSIFVKKYHCAYTIDHNDVESMEKELRAVLSSDDSTVISANANRIVKEKFTKEVIERQFLSILGISDISKTTDDSLNILEVNNVDIAGRRFNGYDLIEYANRNSKYHVQQIVACKSSNDKNVFSFFSSPDMLDIENRYRYCEERMFSIHSQFSFTGLCLENSEVYKKADVVHYHLLDNTKIPLSELKKLFSQKPSVFTIHDLWPLTGRCVSPLGCEKWRDGCKNCEQLDSLFHFYNDNCASLWQEKLKCFADSDIDLVIATDYLNEHFVQHSPIFKGLKNVHILPFGLNLNQFKDNGEKDKWRKGWNIPEDNTVIFFHSQIAMKGIEFIREALELLKSQTDTSKITLITCSEIGNLEELKSTYRIIELGNINDDIIIGAYNACDIFLMPSKSETFGLMAIEAMACSRPIIVFDNMTLPSVTFTPDCGVLVENQNSEKLAEAMLMLINSPDERERRGKLGRELAEKHYDVKDYNERLLKIYEKVYKRQRYKLENSRIPMPIDDDIDYSNRDVQILMHSIRQNQNSDLLFGLRKIDLKFIDDNIVPIDYSNDDVQKLINKFNYEVYRQCRSTAYFEDNNSINCCPKEYLYNPITFRRVVRGVRRRLGVVKRRVFKMIGMQK